MSSGTASAFAGSMENRFLIVCWQETASLQRPRIQLRFEFEPGEEEPIVRFEEDDDEEVVCG